MCSALSELEGLYIHLPYAVVWKLLLMGSLAFDAIFLTELRTVRSDHFTRGYKKNVILRELVSWCFEPSQPQKITSGRNTNFILSPS